MAGPAAGGELPGLSPAATEIQQLHAAGWSYAQIARAIGRSPSLISKIAAGRKLGHNLRPALQELRQTGHTSTVPLRTDRAGRTVARRIGTRRAQELGLPPDTRSARLDAHGHLLPAPTEQADTDWEDEDEEGEEWESDEGAEPQPPPSPPTSPRGAFTTSVDRADDGSFYADVALPKSEGVGRERGRRAIMGHLQEAASNHQQVTFGVTLSDGTHVTVGGKGGYNAQQAYRLARGEGRDPLAFLGEEISKMPGRAGRSDPTALSDPNVRIIGVTVNSY